MKIKNIAAIASATFLLFFTAPAFSANTTGDPVRTTKPAKAVDNARVEQIVKRVEEIKTIDKTTLTGSEKKGLRKELRSLKKEMARQNGGVYLSIGAIIIIILLLILIL